MMQLTVMMMRLMVVITLSHARQTWLFHPGAVLDRGHAAAGRGELRDAYVTTSCSKPTP